MTIDETNIDQTLMAYADGELDGAQSAAVLDFLIAHPQWLTALRDHQRLRTAAWRVVRDSTPGVPDGVRQRVSAMAAEAAERSGVGPGEGIPATPPVTPRPPGRAWMPLARAAAIALVVGLAAGFFIPRLKPAAVSPNVPVTLAAAVTRVHVDCSRFPLHGHAGAFPTAAPLGGLADKVRRAFHTDATHPDLSSLGFEFVGAGPCRQPLEGTAHLLYRRATDDGRETLSIFVQADRGQVELPERQIGVLTAADQPHPAYVWRADGAVFCLVADGSDVADRARQTLQLALAK